MVMIISNSWNKNDPFWRRRWGWLFLSSFVVVSGQDVAVVVNSNKIHNMERRTQIADTLQCDIDTQGEFGKIYCPNLCGPGRDWLVIRNTRYDPYGSPITLSTCSVPCEGPNDILSWECTETDMSVTTDPNVICSLCPNGITAGGGLRNCFFNEYSKWQCFHEVFPLSFVPASMSSLFFTCFSLPGIEPTPGNCQCAV